MNIFKKLLKGNYKVFIKCENCGFSSEVRIPKGISVADFIKGGKATCDNCKVVAFPSEYTTEHFEKEKKKEIVMKQDFQVSPKPNKDYKKLNDYKDKTNYKEGIKWLG